MGVGTKSSPISKWNLQPLVRRPDALFADDAQSSEYDRCVILTAYRLNWWSRSRRVAGPTARRRRPRPLLPRSGSRYFRLRPSASKPA